MSDLGSAPDQTTVGMRARAERVLSCGCRPPQPEDFEPGARFEVCSPIQDCKRLRDWQEAEFAMRGRALAAEAKLRRAREVLEPTPGPPL